MSETKLKITIPQGTLEGFSGQDLDGNYFFQFLGIPYAKPPLGELRFKAPLPAEKWDGIRDATKECQSCYSKEPFGGEFCGSEDCLFLNVFTKSIKTTPKPVMVWIHGGAFIRGTISPKIYGPEFLITEDIVLVAVQYRIGMLGFLRLRYPSLEVFGNAGLKDQNIALKWVQENIAYFGGDPGNVTIFGNSAGATSVSYHLLSPLSRGLFHRAIIQSGSSIKGWDECVHEPIDIAQIGDKNVTTEKQALDLLKALPVEEMYKLQIKYIEKKELHTINKQFGPVIETTHDNAFITKKSIDIIEAGEFNDVPIIVGYNDKEGMLFHYYTIINPKRLLTVEDCIPHAFNLERGSKEREQLRHELEQFYFENNREYEDNLIDVVCVWKYVRWKPIDMSRSKVIITTILQLNLGERVYINLSLLQSDAAYITPSYAMAVNHSKATRQPVYLYRFSLDTPINYMKHFVNLSHKSGASHFDEVSYLLKCERTGKLLKLNSVEAQTVKKMVKLWTNFAKYGNPTPEHHDGEDLEVKWRPFTNQEHAFLDISGSGTFAVATRADRERVQFWKGIYAKFEATKKFL